MRHSFLGFGIHKSACEVEIYKTVAGRYLVILTDIGEGTSVTNAAEQIATEVYNIYLKEDGVSSEDVVWVEHYPESDVPYSIINLEPTEENKVSFARIPGPVTKVIYLGFNNKNHQWTHCPYDMINEMLDGATEITEEYN